LEINPANVATRILLDIGTETPIIGPVMGLFKHFYDSYNDYKGNKEDLIGLKNILEICLCWLKRITPSINNSNEDVILLALQELSFSIENASIAIESLQRMLDTNGVLLGTFLATEQQNIITKQTNSLNKSLNLFLTTLSGIYSMRMLEEEKNIKMKELYKLLQPETFKHIIEDHLHHFQNGSREWLHSEIQEWSISNDNFRLFLLLSEGGIYHLL